MDSRTLLYATDLTDAEWALPESLSPAEASIGRPRMHARRIILNTISYVLRTGCSLKTALGVTAAKRRIKTRSGYYAATR